MPRAPKAAKPAETPAPQTEAPDPQNAAPEEQPAAAQRPSQSRQTAAESRHSEGQVPKLERLIPSKIEADERKALNIYEKWTRIIDEVGLVPKRGWNAHHQYWYTLEADLVAFVGPLLTKYNVMVIPSVDVDKVERIALAEGSKQTLTRLPMLIKIVNGDKPTEVLEIEWIGEGADTVDKGVYKAYTGGLKFFYMKLLLVATGDDPELFTRTDQLGDLAAREAASAPAQAARPVNVRQSSVKQPEKGGHQQDVTDVQMRQVRIFARGLGLDARGVAETFDRVLETSIFDTIDQMDDNDEASRVLSEWIRKQGGPVVGRVLHAMGEEVAKRASEPAAEPAEPSAAAPKPAEQPAPDDEAALLAEAAEGQGDLGLSGDEAEADGVGY